VLFLCEDQAHLDRFLAVADQELTGHQFFWREGGAREDYFGGRDRIFFALATDVYAGRLTIYDVPELPPSHPDRGANAAPGRRHLPHATLE
jgi:hypothetical protein